jgi:hypothetical protein
MTPSACSNSIQKTRYYKFYQLFGISTGTINSQFNLLTQMDTNEHLKFPPMDVPQHSLLSFGFRL